MRLAASARFVSLRRFSVLRRRFTALITAGLLALISAAASSGVSPSAGAPPKRLLFPVVGKTHYVDDFGSARAQGSHQATDIMGEWRAPLVAVEGGRVRVWTKSARAGCMLYLYGASGTTYLYVHMNNDLTAKNDNRGGCRAGVAFATGLRDGETVRAGELLGFMGDSGDANGIHHHVHFELHLGGQSPVSPFPWLKKASQLLFPVPPADAHGKSAVATLKLEGIVRAVTEVTAAPALTLAVRRVILWNGDRFAVARQLTVRVPEAALVQRRLGGALRPASLADVKTGERVTVLTEPFAPSPTAQVAPARFYAAAELTFGPS